MNVFTNLFIPQADHAEPHPFDDLDERFAGYGNRIASARFFAPLGHARAKREQAASESSFDDELAICGCG